MCVLTVALQTVIVDHEPDTQMNRTSILSTNVTSGEVVTCFKNYKSV